MATITLSLRGYECCLWESEIRNAIWEMTGEKGVEIEVQNDGVVVTGCNASAQELIGKIYHKLGMRAVEGKKEEEKDDDDNEEDDDDDDDETTDDSEEEDNEEEEDNDDEVHEEEEEKGDDGEDEDGESEEDDPVTKISEPWWEDQTVTDPTAAITRRMYFL